MWRERLPHYCEGYKSIKSILEPRNYLFNNLKAKNYNNFNDKIWTDVYFMKYARKLNLVETFYTKLKIFENEYNDNNSIMTYPYEIYCKDIEYIKFIRKNIYNYDLGIQICDESIRKFSIFNNANDKDFISYVINNFKEHKAYFNYKKGNIIDAHKLFMEASIYNNKQFTDYHLYYDWAEMCEEIAFLIKNEENATEWFENTIYNYLTTIIYKLDKAKYIIPRMISFIKEFEGESLKDKFNEKINQIPSWVWIFWLPVLFDNFNYYQDNENKNDFYFIILKKVALDYKQIFYYPFTINEKKVMKNHFNNIREKYKEFQKIIFAENKYNHYMDKIKIMIDELTKKEKNNLENSLNSMLNSFENASFRQEISEIKNYLKTIISMLNKFPDLAHVKNNFEELIKKSEITRESFRDCIINNKFYNHNLIVTKNRFNEISKLCEDSIHNIDFTGIELPGYFSNKIEEPTEENILYISKFESDYSQKFNCDAHSKVLIKCSNDKLLNFILVNHNVDKNFDMKIYLMQILFNFIFAKNNQTYKRKILFMTPIKYHINSDIKIVEEDIDIQYNMDEIYEYCLQKRGYSPKIANKIFEDEAEKGKINTDSAYYNNSNNNEKIFYKMCEIMPQDSLKNYIHKFILTTEDIFFFRKQFTISYAINNLFSYIISDNVLLKNISFEKETGFCIFNTDMSAFENNQYNEIIEQKKGTPLRLTKNISFFLSITSIYGIIPEIFYLSCQSLLNKSNDVKNILKICLNDNNIYTNNIKVQNYINKFKYVINLLDDKNYFTNDNIQKSKVNLINKENYDNNEHHQNNRETFDKANHTMKIIYELIENSMNNDNLKKKTIDYEAWF